MRTLSLSHGVMLALNRRCGLSWNHAHAKNKTGDSIELYVFVSNGEKVILLRTLFGHSFTLYSHRQIFLATGVDLLRDDEKYEQAIGFSAKETCLFKLRKVSSDAANFKDETGAANISFSKAENAVSADSDFSACVHFSET